MKGLLYSINLMKHMAGLIRVIMPIFFAAVSTVAFSQTEDKCGTMQLLQEKFNNDPSFKIRFEANERQLQRSIQQRLSNARTSDVQAISLTVPVIFHIVLANQSAVTDAQIQAQVDTLNKDYAGQNGDSVKIPSYFKPLFGKSGIRFRLAQRTPTGEVSNGIERVTTATKTFNIGDNTIKYTALGGADAWNTTRYLNVWICSLSNGVLGYSTFPTDSIPEEQGVVIMYSSLPGGTATGFNGGKTATHEIGHYFNLYHIWGDDNGACTGTDFIDDTPNQGNSTSGCPGGVETDNCSPVSPGIMYQNYMDYSGDDCLVMFTNQQVVRMETAASTYRASLFTSNGALPLVRFSNDAELRLINNPTQRICTGTFGPVVTIRNSGMQPLTTVTINTSIDKGPVTKFVWTGTLATLATISVTIPSLTVASGNHQLTVYTSNPNGIADEDAQNDTSQVSFMYYPPSNPPLTESFEGTEFPPRGWDIVQPDTLHSWKKVTGVAKTGKASVMIGNFNNKKTGRKDYLRLPEVAIGGADSAFIQFQVAAAAYSALTTANNNWDTLEVLLSTDCGNTYTSVYKKWGASLVTRQEPTTQYYVPGANEWRKDSVNITPYIAGNNVLLAFRNTNENENNIYLDDVNVYTKIINPNLKAKGFLVTPNPAYSMIQVQFYPQPVNLRAIALYSVSGQLMATIEVPDGQSRNNYPIDISRYAAGMYIVRAVFSDKVVTQQIIKQ